MFEIAKHRGCLSGGASGDVEKTEPLVGRSTFEPFGNVVGDRKGAVVELVALGSCDALLRREKKILADLRKPDELLPERDIFEAFVGHGVDLGFERLGEWESWWTKAIA